jgi:prepilin-type processing-associated H-X9-DG protein
MLLPVLDQAPVYNLMNMSLRYDHSVQAPAVQTRVPVYLCPSDSQVAQAATRASVDNAAVTLTYAVHNYPGVGSHHPYGLCGGHVGSVTTPTGVSISVWGVFAERNGILNNAGNAMLSPCVRLASITDGTSNTMLFSEFTQNQGKCLTAAGAPGPDYNQAKFGWAQPAVGGSAFTLRAPPNSCNGVGADGSNTGIARSRHTGGVHALLADGSVRFISENINYLTWVFLGDYDDNQTLSEF